MGIKKKKTGPIPLDFGWKNLAKVGKLSDAAHEYAKKENVSLYQAFEAVKKFYEHPLNSKGS